MSSPYKMYRVRPPTPPSLLAAQWDGSISRAQDLGLRFEARGMGYDFKVAAYARGEDGDVQLATGDWVVMERNGIVRRLCAETEFNERFEIAT